MGRLEDQIRDLIKERIGSVAKLARLADIPASTIYSMLSHTIGGASFDYVMTIANLLNIDPYELAHGNISELPQGPSGSADVPMFGTIAAGQPIEPTEAQDMFPIPASLHTQYPNAFLLRVSGESMNRILPNGCYALVDPDETTVVSGKPYALTIGVDSATVKNVRMLENGLELQPDSSDPTFRPQLYDYNDPATPEVRIVGRIVWHVPPMPAH